MSEEKQVILTIFLKGFYWGVLEGGSHLKYVVQMYITLRC